MSVLRVLYREKQILHASDLQDEQQFLLDTLSRHTLNAHSAGIVRGLTLHLDGPSAPVVDPGIAIDANGRQLILWQAKALANELPEGDASDVWLIFCGEQFDERIPGLFPCGPNDYGRSREVAIVQCVPTGAEPPDSSGVLLGSLQRNPNGIGYTIDVSNAKNVILRGANLSHPAKTAFLQIGKSNNADPNELLINITDISGKAINRVALDRNGNILVYGNVELSSYRARGLIRVPEGNALLLVEAALPGPAGERIAVTTEVGKRGISLAFTDVVTGKTESVEEIELSTKKSTRDKTRARFTTFNAESRFVRLKWADAEAAEDTPKLDTDEAALSTSGSSILLAEILSTKQDTGQELHGCQETVPSSESSRSVNGLSFLPASATPIPGAPARGIYSVKLDAKDSQRQEFRLDLGKHQDQDLSRRLAIGTMLAREKRFSPWLTVQGNCAIELVDQQHPVRQLPTSIAAKGYIEQAPIKADPSDLLFKSLMVAAWLNGLRSAVAASSSVSMVFHGVQNPIAHAPWPYKVDVTNIGSQTLSIDKVIETMTYGEQTVVQAIVYQGNVTVGQTATIHVPHASVPETSNIITLEVIVSGKISNASWWNAATTTTTV